MIEVIKLLTVIILIIYLMQKKWNIGYIMALASLALGVLFKLEAKEIALNIIFAILDPITLRLFGIITLVFLLSGILRKIESLKDFFDSLQNLVKDYRLILAFIPAFLGLIPMPAGAIFSAPMIKEVGCRMNLRPEEKTFVNYWFRHIWEFIWPLFSSIILFSALLKVEIREIIMIQFPLTITALILGLVWEKIYLKRSLKENDNKQNFLFNIKKLFLSTWPILLIVVLVLFVKLDLLISLIIVIFSMILLNKSKVKIKDIKYIFKKDIDLSMLFLIAGIMIFKKILQATGAMMVIPDFFTKLGIHPLIILFFIPFFIGMLTGFGSAAIGIGFPVLLPFITKGEVNLSYAMFAFVGGYIGTMVSPVHLCLVVTKNYFKADWGKIYKILIPPLLIIILSAYIMVIIRT